VAIRTMKRARREGMRRAVFRFLPWKQVPRRPSVLRTSQASPRSPRLTATNRRCNSSTTSRRSFRRSFRTSAASTSRPLATRSCFECPTLGMRFASVYGSRGMRCAVIRRRRFDSAATSARLSNEEATTSARRSTLLPGFRHSREVAAPRHRQYSGARS